MASITNIMTTRRNLIKKKMGRNRKKMLAKNGTTLPQAIIFGDEKPAEKK